MRKALFLLAFGLLSSINLSAVDTVISTDTDDPLSLVKAFGEWGSSSDGFRIESSVTEVDNHYAYSYLITDSSLGSLESYFDTFFIEVGDQNALESEVIKDLAVTTNVTTPSFDLGSFNLGPLYGLKFDVSSYVPEGLYLEFQSYLEPTLANFYATGSRFTTAFSSGLLGGDGLVWAPNSASFFADPISNSGMNVPEPSTYFVLATMLFVVMLARKRKNSMKAYRASI